MSSKLSSNGRILGLDIGDARIGLATAHVVARIPAPIETIPNDDQFDEMLARIIKREDVTMLVVGLPRNSEGQETQQSAKVRIQAEKLRETTGLPIEYADESLSSKRADTYMLDQKGNKLGPAQDSVAACFILEEFLSTI